MGVSSDAVSRDETTSGYPMNAEEMARKHGRDGLALRNLLRANPELTPTHVHRTPYEITAADEQRILAHPDYADVANRNDR